jgi:DNA invertase Pin-like site-specific DNA recombinase
LNTGNQQQLSGRLIGYARVSTASQTTDQQLYALRKAGCSKVFVDDGVRATAAKRPGLQKARAVLREHDVFVVAAIDRAFRSTIEAILFLDDIMQHGVAFQSLTQHIDTRTPEGRKWFIDTASWAEYERAIISRRTKEKMAESKRQGKHMGRPFLLTTSQIQQAHALLQQDSMNIGIVAAAYQVSPVTLKRGFKRLRLEYDSAGLLVHTTKEPHV